MPAFYFLAEPGSDIIDTSKSTTTNHLKDGSIIGIVGMIFLIIILLCVSFIFGIWWNRNKRPRRYNKVTPSDLVTLERKILANKNNNNNNNNSNLYSNDLFNKDSYDNYYSHQQQQHDYSHQQQQQHYYSHQQQQQKYGQYNNTTNNNDNNNNNTNISSTSSFPIISSPSPTLKRDKIRNTDTWERYLKMINNPNRLNSVVNSKRTVNHNFNNFDNKLK